MLNLFNSMKTDKVSIEDAFTAFLLYLKGNDAYIEYKGIPVYINVDDKDTESMYYGDVSLHINIIKNNQFHCNIVDFYISVDKDRKHFCCYNIDEQYYEFRTGPIQARRLSTNSVKVTKELFNEVDFMQFELVDVYLPTLRSTFIDLITKIIEGITCD